MKDVNRQRTSSLFSRADLKAFHEHGIVIKIDRTGWTKVAGPAIAGRFYDPKLAIMFARMCLAQMS